MVAVGSVEDGEDSAGWGGGGGEDSGILGRGMKTEAYFVTQLR